SKSNGDGGISKEEYEELKRFYDGDPSTKTLPEKSTMLSLGETNQTETESHLSLSDWFPWQNRQQPTFVVDHSNLTKNFVEMVQFLELQEALDPNEDNYGQEMEVFLNEADILKPGQNDEDGGNIRQFFVTNDTIIKHGKKKKSLYSQNKPRRSDQLPEFDAFVVSGESDDDLPAIFDKKDDKDDEHVAKINAVEITKAYRKSICKDANLNRSEKKHKQKKRNFSGNISVVEVIADTDVNDFVETVPELPGIDEESQGSKSNEDGNEFRDEDSTHVQIDIEQASLSKMEASDYEKKSETEAKSQDEYCEDFTKLLPIFFTMPVDIASPQKITETNQEVFLVPEAPLIDELEVLVENINNLTTLPKIDMARLVEEWTLEYSGLNTKHTSKIEKKNSKDFEHNKSSLKCSDGCDDKTSGQDMGEKGNLDKDIDAFGESFNLSNNGNFQQKQAVNFNIDISSDFDSPIKPLTNKPNKSKRTSPIVQHNTSTSDNFELKISEDNTQSDTANTEKEGTDLVEEPSHKLNEDGAEMEIDSFSGSDDFLDTQANFMLASDDFLKEINSDESNEGIKNKDSSLKLTQCLELFRESVSCIEKQRTGEAECSKSSSSNNKKISSCKYMDISLFDDSFMNDSVLEAIKTQAIVEENTSQSVGRIMSPSQYTFSQALAFVHDSDSTDLSGEREQSGTFKVPFEKEKDNMAVDFSSKQKKNEKLRNDESLCLGSSDQQKNNKPADYSPAAFTAIKPHDKLDTSQLNLINEIVNMDNMDAFSDDGEESDVPLFDLGFDVDDDIIPPSPCLSETTSQKSVLKNLGQSFLSSRKSLSFMCDKSRLVGQKNSTVLKPALSPTGEELELEQADGDDFEKSYSKVDEVSKGNKRTSATFSRKDDTFNVNPVNFDAGDNVLTQQNEDEDNISLSDLHGDFEMPPSPVLSGKRLLSQKPVFSPVNLEKKSPDGLKSDFSALDLPDQGSPLMNLSIQDSPSMDDSFIVRKKRKKTLIINSPITPDIREKNDFDDFKTPLRPVSARVKKNISSTSSEEESILKKKPKKAVSFCVEELLDDESDFEDIMSIKKDKRNKSTDNETKNSDSNKRDSYGSKRNSSDNNKRVSYENKKRKSKSPSNPFLVDEADVSEDEEASTDEEEGSDLDQMEESFVSEGCTQLSQGQHEELQAIYLKSVRSPTGQGGKFKLKYDYDDNIDVYSQVPQDEESQYYDDSFVCDEEEEHDLLEGHEITILDKGNIIDNESFAGPRTRWSKPARHKVMPTVKPIKRKRVKRIADSSSEDESDNQNMNLMSPAEQGRKFLDSPAMTQGHGTVSSRSSNRNSRQLLSSSDDEQKEEVISPEIMCSLKSRKKTNKQNLANVTSNQLSNSHILDASAEMTISKEKEERIRRQKEKQEEFRKHLIAKQQNNESVDKTNSYCDDTALLTRRDLTITEENSLLTEDSDLLLNTTKPSNNKSVIIVDSREINGAQDIVSTLRFNHNINVVAAQLDSCDYVVSVRMGVDRKQWSEFSNGTNRAKMTERLLEMCDFYERPCLIIEKDKCKPEELGRILHWTKYVDKTLVHLIQSKMTLFFTENQLETASIVADLCQLENRKNCAISCPINLNTDQQNRVKFYRSIPHLSYVHCLFLCNNYKTVASFLCSDIRTIMTNGKMTEERASNVYKYIRRMFDTQMLPSSYG
ncbi:fanconi anemia group M protein, partial [Mytilus galloprovincialis]